MPAGGVASLLSPEKPRYYCRIVMDGGSAYQLAIEVTDGRPWDAGVDGRRVTLSPDGSILVFPCDGGNGTGCTVYAFDSSDLTNVRGEWDIGKHP